MSRMLNIYFCEQIANKDREVSRFIVKGSCSNVSIFLYLQCIRQAINENADTITAAPNATYDLSLNVSTLCIILGIHYIKQKSRPLYNNPDQNIQKLDIIFISL